MRMSATRYIIIKLTNILNFPFSYMHTMLMTPSASSLSFCPNHQTICTNNTNTHQWRAFTENFLLKKSVFYESLSNFTIPKLSVNLVKNVLNKIGTIFMRHDSSSWIEYVMYRMIHQVSNARCINVSKSKQSSWKICRIMISPKHTSKLFVKYFFRF